MLGIDRESARNAWSFAAVALLIWGFFIVRKTVLMFVLALMFAYLLYPLVALLQRKLTSGALLPALLIIFIGMPLIIAAIVFLLRHPLANDLRTLRQQVSGAGFKNSVTQWHLLGIPIGQQIASQYNVSRIQNELVAFMPQIKLILSRAGRDISNLVLVPILAFLFLNDGRKISSSVVDLFFHADTSNVHRRIVEGILDDAHALILEYMRALVLLCFSVLVVFGIILSILRVKYGLLLALLAFPLEFVPLVGPVIAGLSIVGVCEFNHYPHIGLIVAFLIVYRLIQDYVLSPHLMKKSVKLHPLLIIFGVFAGGEIGGVGGIFLSVPFLAIARLVFYEYQKQSKLVRTLDPEAARSPVEEQLIIDALPT